MGLYRRYSNGDDRIDGKAIENFWNDWEFGNKVDWRSLGPKFIKRNRRIPNWQIREDGR